MSISPIPVSSLKKKPQDKKADNFSYNLYECVYLLRTNKFKKKNEVEKNNKDAKNEVKIVSSAFQEINGRYLVALVCSNGSLLLQYREENGNSLMKQINWFENPLKKIVALCIDPLRAAWLLCACADSILYLIPALAMLKERSDSINAASTWSKNDLSKILFAKPPKGKPTCIEWWHTLDDTNIGIVGTDEGELIFVDLSQHQEVARSTIKEKIDRIEIHQDINERTSYLYIYAGSKKKWTLQLLLEQPSQSSNLTSPSSLTQAFDMGYDMVAECNVESILNTNRNDNKDEVNLQNRIEVLPNDFMYTNHFIGERYWIAKHDLKFNALEVFSDIKQTPEYVYHIPAITSHILLSKNLIFTVRQVDGSISILSRHFSATSFGRQGLKKLDPSMRSDIQLFQLPNGETVISCYKIMYKRPAAWNELFPHCNGYHDNTDIFMFLIITDNGVLECRPRMSPENYFTELALKLGTDIAGKLGITLDLNVPLLYEFAADKAIQEKDLPNAVKFYNLSKCDSTKRAVQLAEYISFTDSLIFIKQVLKKQPNNISAKEKKQLSDMAIICYVEQTLECHRSGTFSKNLAESFRAFICDNFDYDEQLGMELLLSYGMIDNLFEMAKSRGKIEEALCLLSSHGMFYLPSAVQIMLLDCGYADIICKSSNGVFVKHMASEQAARFLLSNPNITSDLIQTLSLLLPSLDETILLQIARVFDPSRQFIKPFLERFAARKRTSSKISMTSNASTTTLDDPTVPNTTDIILMFLKTIIKLNEIRKTTSLPNLKLISRHLSGQLSWSATSFKRSDSLLSNELPISESSQMKLACGRHHTAFVTSEKELYTWGKTSSGRLGHGDLIEDRGTYQPFRVESLHMHGIQVLSVACGALHTIALCQEGVFAWGSNKYGQLGIGDKRNRSRPVLLTELSSKYVTSVVCGTYHSFAISSDYKLYSWGWGVHGQLGLKSVENQTLPQRVHLLNEHRVIQVAAGYAHSAVLTSRGLVFTFGGGLYGQLGIGSNSKRTTPQLVNTLVTDTIYLIACSPFETVAVSDEQILFCWGRNHHQFHICGKAENASYGRQMASNKTDLSHRYLPEDLPFKLNDPIKQLVCGNWHYMALTTTNIVYTWGCNDSGQLGHYNKIEQLAPRPVKALSRRNIVAISAGSEFSVVIDDEDQVLAWGRADGGLIGIENESSNSVARRSAYSVLAPTAVQGLPIHFDQVSIGSGKSMQREFIFDQNYELPDLSSVGEDQAPYTCEAVLLSLYKLNGLYNPIVVAEYALKNEQWFVLSFCYEVIQEWHKVFIYRAKAVKTHHKQRNSNSTKGFYEKMNLVVVDLLNKFEDFITEDIDEESSFVAMVTCLIKIFDFWLVEEFEVTYLEDAMRKHMEFLAPLYTVVLFGFLNSNKDHPSHTLRFALYQCQTQHKIAVKFSSQFFNELLLNVINQLGNEVGWYSFLCTSKPHVEEDVAISEDSPSLTVDEMVAEIVEHKRKIFFVKPYISLSNAVATTLAAATIAQGVENNDHFSTNIHFSTNDQLSLKSDSVVFTCCHNLPRYYMLETVVPEFESRMSELPEALCHTASVMARFYKQCEMRIPMACPYCVYNNLRSSQLQALRESGLGIVNIRSTIWEI